MRFIFGFLVGVAIAVGAAYVHDRNLRTNPAAQEISDRPIVNWDVLSAVAREQTDMAKNIWHDLTGR